MRKIFLLTVLIITVSGFVLRAQEKKTDEIHLKYFGTVRGKVIKIKQSTVEFRSGDNDLLYDYPKTDIDYIILSTGEWISFNQENNFSEKESSAWGYFSLNGGGIVNLRPLNEAKIRKQGISFLADLNYQFNKFYSLGIQLGYSSVNLNGNNFLVQNGFSGTKAAVNGGTSYLMSVGLVNRIFIFTGSFVEPILSIFSGYGNLLTSETDVDYITGKKVFPDSSKKGFLTTLGTGLFIKTGITSGIKLESGYNWFFYKNEKKHFVNFNLGCVIPIN